MRRPRRLIALGAAGALTAVPVVLAAGGPAQAKGFDYTKAPQIQKRIMSGWLTMQIAPKGDDDRNADVALSTPPRAYQPAADDGCQQYLGNNVRTTQNCLNISDPDLQGRGQAENETSIAVDPTNVMHVVGSQNDYRRGDGNCYAEYSLDGGKTWVDSTVPMGFSRGTAYGKFARQYWEAGGDTSVAWDTRGNAYLSCQVFNRGSTVSPNPDQSSAFLVFRSTGNHGASWNFTGRPVAEHNDTAGAGNFLLDKQLLTVDNHMKSPFRDRVYVTWTTFAADGTAYIYESYSKDYGETFSAPVLVSANSSLCKNTFGVPTPHGTCNENQFSQPFTGPDGSLYVVWANFNNAVYSRSDNHNQMLLAKSTDGGRTFSAPVRVGDYYDLPDCATYQGGADLGRACVPEKGATANSIFRATNYPVGAVDPTNPGHVVVSYGSYINRNSNEKNGCVPESFSSTTGDNLYKGVKTPGACNNDIIVSTSWNAGRFFDGVYTNVRSMPDATSTGAQPTTDQFWQWLAFRSDGALAVSYYDRQYGTDEMTGYSDISVSGSAHGVNWAANRVTTGSMPPPTQFSGLFYGDYSGMDVTGMTARPLWSDTRNVDLFLCPGTGTVGHPPAVCTGSEPNGMRANDQDVFTAAVAIPTP